MPPPSEKRWETVPEASTEKTILRDYTLRNSERSVEGEVFLLLGFQRTTSQEGRAHILTLYCQMTDRLLCSVLRKSCAGHSTLARKPSSCGSRGPGSAWMTSSP